ncbi:MAG: HD domain-containing protein [Desulfonatronovibrionaceae bacterium]
MPSIRKGILQLIFSGSFMKRWNDKMRPMELVEVDKQAHKMIAALVLFQLNTSDMSREEAARLGTKIVRGGIFEYLYRLIITDIKPPVFYKIKANPAHYQQLTRWVLEQLQPRLQPLGEEFCKGMESYFLDPGENDLGTRILQAAHVYASSREFDLIKGVNPVDDELLEIEGTFSRHLEEYADLQGMRELIDGPSTELGRFVHVCGQLRFQKRWSQTPRIPETSVLGHMFIVACYAYFFSLALKACPLRCQNNFFAGLLHDVPELLTRDIISPVKQSVMRIGDLIKEYENSELERRIFSPLRTGGYHRLENRIKYLLGMEVGSEFNSSIIQNGEVSRVSLEALQKDFNSDRFDPKDGEMLKVCDNLAAFIEAYTATRNGITNEQLQQAQWRIRSRYQQVSLLDELHIGALLADFD